VKEAVSDLFKDGTKGMTDYQKAKKIYEFIADNVRYSNVSFLHSAMIPQKASRTLSTKLGDCKDVSTLFVAMCKEVGVKSNLVLVDTRDNGDYDFTLPTIGFNHCIARLKADGKEYYVELTDQKLSFTTIPSELLGSLSLNIPTDVDTASTTLGTLQSKNRVPNSVFRETNIHFDNNDMLFTRKYIRTGEYAANMRNSYADIGKEKQEKKITQMISEDFSNPVKISNLNFKDLKTLSDTFYYSFDVHVSNQLSDVVGIKIVKLPWSSAVTSLDFVSLETRKFPFKYWDYNGLEINREVINMDIPAGKVLAEVPQNVSLSCPVATYSITFKASPGKLSAVRELKQTADILSVDDYAAFKTFYQKVAETYTKQIGFKTGTATTTAPKPTGTTSTVKPATTSGTAVKH
jgi:hypothetical protein